MTDYYSPTVIQPEIPLADISPLEKLTLAEIFPATITTADDTLYIYTDDHPYDQLSFLSKDLREAAAASSGFASQIAPMIAKKLNNNASTDEIDLDLSGTSFEFILQDIVRRSKTLSYLTAVTSFLCSKPRADGFGGCATFITAGAITGMSTNEFLEQQLVAAIPKASGTPFQIDPTGSNEDYLAIDIPTRHATVSIKAESEGVVVDIYPLHAAGASAATAAVLTSDLISSTDT